MHVLEELAREHKLLCPDTGAPVRLEDRRVVSVSGREFGEIPGPLNMLKGRPEPYATSQVPPAEVERVREKMQLPPGGDVEAEIAKAIAWTGARLQADHLSAESRLLAERFRIPEFTLAGAANATGSAVSRAVAAVESALRRDEARLETISHSVGERLKAGDEVYRSVRVRNRGVATLRCAGPGAATVETRWIAGGREVARSTRANALPVDLEPGREITLILRIAAPATPGPHELRIHLAAPGAVGEPFLAHRVDVGVCDLPVFDYEYHPAMLDYDTDHRVAAEDLKAFIASRYPGRPLSLLELGGGVHPTSWGLVNDGHRLIAADISHSQSILGALYFRHALPGRGDSFAFLSCDGAELPFGDEALDGAMLFAAFHHFADPVGLLRQMRRVIRPDGFIYIACDCCAPNPLGDDYIEELKRGINEQMWSLPEYAAFFREAGLEVVRARVDFHSIKVAVAKRPASG